MLKYDDKNKIGVNIMIEKLNKIIDNIGKQNLMIGIGVFIVLIIIYLISRSTRLKHYKKQTVEVENRMNAIKSLPIQYRLGRVQNIAKSMPEISEKYESFQEQYNQLMTSHKDKIALLINEVDEQLYFGKLRKVSSRLKDVKILLEEYETTANILLSEIEEITEIENAQRLQIIKIKERFRASLDKYETIRFEIDQYIPALLEYIESLEQIFIELEEFMNSQRFEDANAACLNISERIDHIDKSIELLPDILTVVNKYIPKRINALELKIEEMQNKEYSLSRLDVDGRLESIQEFLEKIVDKVQKLDLADVSLELDEVTRNINSMFELLEVEESSLEEFKQTWKIVFNKVNEVKEKYEFSVNEYKDLLKLYVIEDEKMDLSKEEDTINAISKLLLETMEAIDSNKLSYQEIVIEMNVLLEKSIAFEDQIQYFFTQRDQMYLTEKRALDELENINIVLLEIKSQIKNSHLPKINESYKDYISDSYKKANEIQFLCKSRPIILEKLSKQVDIARDIIYRLYDNVHNLIVTAGMVEEAIVFGNRYRSSFLEVNTELTKTEVLFRNGEYTKALSTAVDIIEKIEPGSYERLIKKSDSSQTSNT